MTVTSPPDDGVFRLMFVCTANRCRSPMAQAVATEMLAQRGVDAEVVSCGVMEGGSAASAGAVRAMARRGIDLSTHLSHQMDSHTVDAANLIVTMERRHLASVAELSMSAVERAFTLPELGDLATVVGPRRAEVDVAAWVAQANAMRLPGSVLTMNSDSDIEDPMGGPNRAYRKTADQIDELLQLVLGSLFPQR
jgi:protein-tyrosine phosphatase